MQEFKTALGSAHRKTKTIENYVTALRMFSEFLRPKGITLKDLLGNADRLAAYKDEFMKVASANSRNYVGEHWQHSGISRLEIPFRPQLL
ncbi:phage integrase SAM-like domain-containing protein [Bradyrhizobium cajani]|uniref:phage integrase SAM-like domain-containing protein n=1 Tax=Bradyrhizobium cajani TaxID=1928661 RepID=UPI001FED094B|nr:phage integrase SAM-like domain-containing protein [Bradyrhizobium cajani]MCP3367621.1 phage integrase SAM-like domain-containing protein [Bradyrhizobium cajani]